MLFSVSDELFKIAKFLSLSRGIQYFSLNFYFYQGLASQYSYFLEVYFSAFDSAFMMVLLLAYLEATLLTKSSLAPSLFRIHLDFRILLTFTVKLVSAFAQVLVLPKIASADFA